MEARELRIGNIIRHTAGAAKVIYLEKNKIYAELLDETILPFIRQESMSGEPITADWLERAGIREYDTGTGVYYDWLFRYQICLKNDRKAIFLFNEERGEAWFFAYIKYVHQLQNFYFALTGKELTITL
jgi:hypothetical protein